MSSADQGIPLLTEVVVAPLPESLLLSPLPPPLPPPSPPPLPSPLPPIAQPLPTAPALDSPSVPAWAPMLDPLPAPSARPLHDQFSTELADDADQDIPLLDTPIAPSLFIDSAPAVAMPPPTQPIPPSAPSFSARDWERLHAEVTERITGQLLGRIDFMLEQRVRDSLADVLQVAVEGLAQEIRRGLHQTVEDVIARAVAQEIAHLQIPKY